MVRADHGTRAARRTPCACDLSSGADREALVEAAVAEYGPVDILVNNAAVTFFIPTGQFPEKRYKLMEEVQVYGPLHLTQLVLASMRERKTGWVVNVSSHAALHPKLDSGGSQGTVYGMCKAALERFSSRPGGRGLRGRRQHQRDLAGPGSRRRASCSTS